MFYKEKQHPRLFEGKNSGADTIKPDHHTTSQRMGGGRAVRHTGSGVWQEDADDSGTAKGHAFFTQAGHLLLRGRHMSFCPHIRVRGCVWSVPTLSTCYQSVSPEICEVGNGHSYKGTFFIL